MDTSQFTGAESSSPLQRIGSGFCGTVWANADLMENRPTTATSLRVALAMKREDGGPGRSLKHEWEIHTQILKAYQDHDGGHRIRVLLPFNFGFLDQTAHNTWASILPRLPAGYEECNALINEKIPPLNEAARTQLIRRYCPLEYQDQVSQDINNRHCLARIYLGRRRLNLPTQQGRRGLRFFSLRNFPLHLDQLESLGLSLPEYAIAMADAMAFLHWVAKVDANDVEFVLGGPRLSMDKCLEVHSKILGTHAVWMLDFDCCRPMSMDEAGVEQAARSFWRNDPYYPRPPGPEMKSDDIELWRLFIDRFLHSSKEMLLGSHASVRRLPDLLVQRIIETRGVYARAAII